MNLQEKLTVLLALKGREEYTPRWLDFHAQSGLRSPVLIGDGAPNDRTESLIEGFTARTSLKATYLRYDDSGYLQYYRKMADLVARADTPYVHIAANDDFLLPSGLDESIRFLEDHPDYASCGGGVAGIYVSGPELGQISRPHGEEWFGLGPVYAPFTSTAATPRERVLSVLGHYVPTWYSVHRRDALQQGFDAVVEQQITEPRVAELCVALHVAVSGKQSQTYERIGYLRQRNSSQLNASLPDFFNSVFQGALVRDVQHMGQSLAARIAQEAGGDPSAIRQEIMGALTDFYRQRNLPPPAAARRLQRAKPWFHLARMRLPLVHRMAKRWERRALLRLLTRNGAAPAYLTRYRADLEMVLHTIHHPINLRVSPGPHDNA